MSGQHMEERDRDRDRARFASNPPGKRQKTRKDADPRTLIACQNCRNKKVKCSGTFPCQYCEKRALDCVFSGLENDTVHRQHRQDISNVYPGASTNSEGPRNSGPPLMSQGTPNNIEHLTPLYRSTASPGSRALNIETSPESVIATVSELSSSDTFGTELKTALRSSAAANVTPAPAVNESVILSSLEDAPTQDEVDAILAIVNLNVGVSQQLFDLRDVLDYISRLYDEPSLPIPNLYLVQILLVFAVGRLLQAKSPKTGGPPGFSLFEEAKRRIPPMDVLQKSGIVAIEDLGLIALYLQIVDRKDDAYIFSNMALRLAIRFGLHRINLRKGFHRSAAVRPNRLWWSIYMQERRLTAAGGYPLSLRDDDITTPLPYDVVGFAPATPIYVNAQIARVVGRITSTIYGVSVKTDTVFLAAVQDILNSLHSIEIEMPKEYLVDFTADGLYVAGQPFHSCSASLARTASSLHLSIYQALIHTLRPLMLHIVRNRHQEQEFDITSNQLQSKMIEICVESARKGLLIMLELKNAEIIAKHAFLDLDTIFSISFIFILLQAISSSYKVAEVGIARSRSILAYLAHFENKAASDRLHEIDQITSGSSNPRGGADGHASDADSCRNTHVLEKPFRFLRPLHEPPINGEGQGQANHGINPSNDKNTASQHNLDEAFHQQMSLPDSSLLRDDDTWPLVDIFLEDEPHLFQVYQSALVPSAGVDFLDWEALDANWAQPAEV